MKNIFLKFSFIVFACFYSCSANSQIIITRGGNNGNLPSDFLSSGQYYYKDVNNYLDNFVGTWEYINGSEKFQIILTKLTNFHFVSTKLEFDFYEDGIALQYKKYVNNILTFESPVSTKPIFYTSDGNLLDGYMIDYGRITKTIYYPHDPTLVFKEGGEFIHPICRIEKVTGNPLQVKFDLYLTGTINYDRETYAGQPTYSIPNDIILTKI